MIQEPKCYTRGCIHYMGVAQPDGTELSERNVCRAFPDGIPHEIAYGDNMHEKPLKGQRNKLVFEGFRKKEYTRTWVDMKIDSRGDYEPSEPKK